MKNEGWHGEVIAELFKAGRTSSTRSDYAICSLVASVVMPPEFDYWA